MFSWRPVLRLTFLALLLLAGCRGATGALRGVTTGGVSSLAGEPPDASPQIVTVNALVDDPAAYEGAFVEVQGDFRQPLPSFCDSKPRPSPAGWALGQDEHSIPAAGLADQLRQLGEQTLTMTVSGRWQRWEGPVGCGRDVTQRELWYLDAVAIVDPNPLSVALAVVPDEAIGDSSQPPPPATIGPPGPPVVTTPTPGASGGLPGDTLPGTTPSISTTVPSTTTLATVPPLDTATTSSTPTLGVTSVAPTPSATGLLPASPTPAATLTATPLPTETAGPGGAPTATATEQTPEPPIISEQIELEVGSLETASLLAGEIHRWPFVVTSTQVITVNVASEISTNIAITILDPVGNTVAQQDNASGGAPEVVQRVALNEAGTYFIDISAAAGQTGNYAVLVNSADSYPFIFWGTLAFGGTGSATMATRNDHFWHFAGQAGQVVTIVLTPAAEEDLFIRLYGPDALILVDFHNETGAGEVETLLSFSLPAAGFYSVLVGEVNFLAGQYEITLTQG